MVKYEKPKEVSIGDIDGKFLKKQIVVVGLIEKVTQTGGPTVFELSDGTGNFLLKGFIAPGERAFPEIDMGDYVSAIVKVEEFNGEIEGSVIKISKKVGQDREQMMKVIEDKQRERARVVTTDFMSKSDILEKMRDSIVKAATEIRLAVIQNRPIIVRHHNDTDGYCSGFALQKAIVPLIEKQHTAPKAAWEYFKRAPSMAPYYEIDDSIKDSAFSLSNVAKFSNKMPLIIIADNGSGMEDLMAIKQAKVHGADVIVIDHHGFDEDVISAEVLAHVNPHLIGVDGSNISAGMICSEVARFINEDVENIIQLPAMSGYSDRIYLANSEIVDEYLKMAEADGYTKDLLNDISLVMEFVSAKVRFMESREYIDVLFGEPREHQKNLVALMAPYISNLDAKGLAIGKAASNTEKVGRVTLQTVDVETSFPGFGFFPKPGRCVGMLHDNLQEETGVAELVSVGIMSTAITFRATDKANFSSHELIKFLQEKLPDAFIEGGGHKNAASVSFVPRMKTEVWNAVKEFVGSR